MRYTRDFADRRRVTDDKKEMNRLYAVESTPTLTGAKADHRLPLRASEIEAFARALAGAVGVGQGGAASLSNATADKWVTAIAKDLQAHRGRSVVVPGDYQPAASTRWRGEINQTLGNMGVTVTTIPTVEVNPTDQLASIRDLSQAMEAGQVAVLVILGANPVFTAPADLQFQERLQKVALSFTTRSTRTRRHVLPLEPAGGARARELERRARLRRHRDDRAAVDCATLRRPHDRRGARRRSSTRRSASRATTS